MAWRATRQSLYATNHQRGFTLLEALLVMGLIAIVVSLTTVNLGQPQTAASMVSIADNLRADLRAQQLRAMSGDTAGNPTSQTYGVRVESGKYILFTGTYAAGNADNFEVAPDTGITLSTTLPGGQASFAKATGELSGLTASTNSITITDSRSGDSKTIRLNRYGAVTLQ